VGESSSIGIEQSSSSCWLYNCWVVTRGEGCTIGGGEGEGCGVGWLLLVKKASVEEAKEEIDRDVDCGCCVFCTGVERVCCLIFDIIGIGVETDVLTGLLLTLLLLEVEVEVVVVLLFVMGNGLVNEIVQDKVSPA
jgi:hypothetical protein